MTKEICYVTNYKDVVEKVCSLCCTALKKTLREKFTLSLVSEIIVFLLSSRKHILPPVN